MVEKHLSLLKWSNEPNSLLLTLTIPCKINREVLDEDGNIITSQGIIYVGDILSAAGITHDYMNKLLAATIKAIFVVCRQPNIKV